MGNGQNCDPENFYQAMKEQFSLEELGIPLFSNGSRHSATHRVNTDANLLVALGCYSSHPDDANTILDSFILAIDLKSGLLFPKVHIGKNESRISPGEEIFEVTPTENIRLSTNALLAIALAHTEHPNLASLTLKNIEGFIFKQRSLSGELLLTLAYLMVGEVDKADGHYKGLHQWEDKYRISSPGLTNLLGVVHPPFHEFHDRGVYLQGESRLLHFLYRVLGGENLDLYSHIGRLFERVASPIDLRTNRFRTIIESDLEREASRGYPILSHIENLMWKATAMRSRGVSPKATLQPYCLEYLPQGKTLLSNPHVDWTDQPLDFIFQSSFYLALSDFAITIPEKLS